MAAMEGECGKQGWAPLGAFSVSWKELEVYPEEGGREEEEEPRGSLSRRQKVVAIALVFLE